MNKPSTRPEAVLQYYSTAPYPCSYLPEQQARSVVVGPANAINSQLYSSLVAQGYRRSGLFTYKPDCAQCRACQPLRIAAHQFVPNRSQRRTWAQHSGLVAQLLPLHFVGEHYELYQRYQAARHPGGGMDLDEEDQYVEFLLQSHVPSRLVEFREPADHPHAPNCLRMVAVVDLLRDGLSAVYTFFDPNYAGSLGTYGVLWEIEQVKRMHLTHLYLGYWIETSRKMQYKAKFRPFQVLVDGQWQDFSAPVKPDSAG